MPIRLDSNGKDFPGRFRDLLALKRESAQDVEQSVRGIIADIAERGDARRSTSEIGDAIAARIGATVGAH